jgi:hypothetical protein
LFDKATINLENGNRFTINTLNNNANRPYIQSARLNGKPLERNWIWHSEIVEGGILEFEMSDSPSVWASADSAIPSTGKVEQTITPAPFIASGQIAFEENTTVTLGVADKQATIYYRLGEEPFKLYTQPLQISQDALLEVYAEKEGITSARLKTRFYKTDPSVSIKLESTYANQYSAGGDRALIDGILGSADFRTGAWQGYQDQDVVAVVDLGRLQPIEDIKVNFLQDQRSWIFLPTQVECYVSDRPYGHFKELGKQSLNSASPSDQVEISSIKFPMKGYQARYVKLIARRLGSLPSWHLGAPYNGKAWIFIDEIEIVKPDEKKKFP